MYGSTKKPYQYPGRIVEYTKINNIKLNKLKLLKLDLYLKLRNFCYYF